MRPVIHTNVDYEIQRNSEPVPVVLHGQFYDDTLDTWSLSGINYNELTREEREVAECKLVDAYEGRS